MSDAHGKFCWYELMTTDADAAARFYTAVVGWAAVDSGMTGHRYTLLQVAGQSVGGLMALPPEAAAGGARPGWVGYVAVDDVDAHAVRLTQAGGQVCKPAEDIPGVGRFAVVADPHGAVFCLFKDAAGGDMPAPAAPGTPGRVGWHELHAGALAAEWPFYESLFGWKKTDALDMGPMGVYQLWDNGRNQGGMMTKSAEMPASAWLYYVNTDAADAAVARIEAGGGRVLMGPQEVPGGSWIVQALDPQGAHFALVAPRR